MASTIGLGAAFLGAPSKAGISLGTVLGISSLASGVLGAFGSARQGQASANAANLQAAILAQQAEQERSIAALREKDFRRDQSRLLASRRAALGASGVEADSGSPLLVAQDFAAEVERNAQRIKQGGIVQSTRLDQQATLLRRQAGSARTGGFISAGASLLGGIGRSSRIFGSQSSVVR